jgi:hypothetical protein
MENCLQFNRLFVLSKALLSKTSCNFYVNLNLYKDFNIPIVANNKFCNIVLFLLCEISGLACSIKNLFTDKKHTQSVPASCSIKKVKRRVKVI